MTRPVATPADALLRTYAAKARAEIDQADRMLPEGAAVPGSGDPLGRVLLVKGAPGPEDRAGRRALAGPDGDAAAKALQALGRDPASVWATCSRPLPCDAETVARRLILIVEAVDPEIVLALDEEAAGDLAAALRMPALQPGRPSTAGGRVVGAVDGLAASLSDRSSKARVWRQMQAVFAARPCGPRAASRTRKGRPEAPRVPQAGSERED